MSEKLSRIEELNKQVAVIDNCLDQIHERLDKITHAFLQIDLLLEKEVANAEMKREYLEQRNAVNKRLKQNRINDTIFNHPAPFTNLHDGTGAGETN